MTSTPTIIMVGGIFTTEDGTVLDSRQPMVGDPRGQVLYRTLSRSHLWWEVVRSLADAVVKSKPSSYALVDGPRQVFDLISGGAIKRVSLSDFLAVGTPESNWRFPFEEFRAGVSFDDVYQRAAALVDISQANTAGSAMLTHLGALLRRNPRQVVIVPHTHYLQEFYGQVALAGQGEEAWAAYSAEHPRDTNEIRREPDPLHYTSAIPVDAEFKITGLIENEAWQDPSDLEAARALLQSRYDLTIGIWDLASNPTLRATLLEVVEVRPAPPVEVAVPAAARARAKSKLDKEQSTWEEWATRLDPLTQVGWERRRGGGVSFSFALCEPVQGPRAALHLWLSLSKTQATVRVQCELQEVYLNEGLQRYLVVRQPTFDGIASPTATDLEATTPAIWVAQGGTATDGIDWAKRGRSIAECTPKWQVAFGDLIAECRRIGAVPQMERMLNRGRITFDPDPH
jgi:hypothetical protein